MTCSFWWGYGGIATVVWSIDQFNRHPQNWSILWSYHAHESPPKRKDNQWFQNNTIINIGKEYIMNLNDINKYNVIYSKEKSFLLYQ